MKEISFIYIAGSLTPRGLWSTNPAIDHEINKRKMVRAALDVFFAGFNPFVPAFDWQFWWVMEDGEFITEAQIKRYSKEWLSRCDAILLIPGWQKSSGTLGEIAYAQERGIPVFESIEELRKYNEGVKNEFLKTT